MSSICLWSRASNGFWILPLDSSHIDDGSDGVGIALLVALHLLELWAVEIVGPTFVAKAWDDVTYVNGK